MANAALLGLEHRIYQAVSYLPSFMRFHSTGITVSVYKAIVTVKRYNNPITGLDRPIGFQEAEAPRFQENRHIKVVRLSALRNGRLYPPVIIPGIYFC
jgi:hypothetical protein